MSAELEGQSVDPNLSGMIGLGGGAGGLILAILVAFGVKERLGRVEQTAVSKETCRAVQGGITAQLQEIRRAQEKAEDRAAKHTARLERKLDWLVERENGGMRPPELT